MLYFVLEESVEHVQAPFVFMYRGEYGMQLLVNQKKNGSVVYKYTAFLLAALLFIAASFTGVTIYFNAYQLRTAKIERFTGAVRRAVKDLDNQFKILQSIATTIEVTEDYQPLNLERNVYNEIALLEDFSSFRNWSPLCSQYYMLYRGSNKVYRHDEKISYWKYMATAYGLEGEEEIYQQMNHAEEGFLHDTGKSVWIFLPLRFQKSSTGQNAATVVFVIEKERMLERIAQIAGENLEDFRVIWKDSEIYCSMGEEQKQLLLTSELEEQQSVGNNLFYLTSGSGSLRIDTFLYDSLLEDLKGVMTSKIYISIALCVLLCIGLAVLMARISVAPVRKLVMKYGNPQFWKENEFELLDNILITMKEHHNLTTRELRKQFLAFALRGYYDSRQNARWSAFNLSLDRPFFCVCVVDAKQCSRERMEKLADTSEGSAPDHVTFYAAANTGDEIIEVIINYEEEEQLSPALEQLNQVMLLQELNVFAGSSCDNQQLLPLSYMQALTAMQKSRRISAQNEIGVKQFAKQMVEAAKAKNSALLNNLCQQFGQQIKTHNRSMILLKHSGYELTNELIHLCGQSVRFDEARLSEILLLQDFDILLSELIKLLWNAFPVEEIRESTRNDVLSRAIVDYIEENVSDSDFGLDKLSQRFGFSADYISGIVKKSMGRPFKEYLTMRRLELAKELMTTNPEMTINEISLAVGYRKASNFIKKFKEVFGYTPAQYRA